MAINPLKVFLFAGGGVAAVAGTAYVAGAFDPLFAPQQPAQIATLPEAPEPADTVTAPGTGDRLPAADAGTIDSAAPAAEPPPAADASAPSAPASEPPAAVPSVIPTFDVVRVESNGSVVIAGDAAPKAKVEALNNGAVLGASDAGPNGAFAIVLDTPLKPGDYQITLRATTPDGTVSSSAQTAVVSIPEKLGGQVLAMVEEPGKPAQLMAVPEPDKAPEAAASPAESQPAEASPPAAAEGEAAATAPAEAKPEDAASPAEAPSPAPEAPAAVTEAPAAEEKPAMEEPAAVAAAKVVVEAVEIDGSKIFVAGVADPGRKVRAYANDMLLGDATASPDGHFLVEANRDLPVGTYTVRVDALDADGGKVVARATVPFEREPGEAIAAVAPSAPAAPEESAQAEPPAQPSTPEQPAVASKTPAGGEPAGTPAPEQPADVSAAPPPADGVPATASPKLEQVDSAVIIRRHDTLWRISRRVYGRGIRYSTIYLANQDQISDPDRIWPGQVFKLPEKSREGEPADLKVLGDQITTAPSKE